MEFKHLTTRNSQRAERARRRAEQIYGATYGAMSFGFAAFLVGSMPLPLAALSFLAFAGFLMLLASGVATLACRLAGVSQEGETREVIRRDARAILAPLLREAPVLDLEHRGKPWASLNREGIFHKDWQGNPRGISWLEVETCTFSTKHDALGKRDSSCLLLHTRGGRMLLQMSPTEEQASHLLPAIRFYLRGESLDSVASTST